MLQVFDVEHKNKNKEREFEAWKFVFAQIFVDKKNVKFDMWENNFHATIQKLDFY